MDDAGLVYALGDRYVLKAHISAAKVGKESPLMQSTDRQGSWISIYHKPVCDLRGGRTRRTVAKSQAKRGCFVHFVRLATALLKEESARDNHA